MDRIPTVLRGALVLTVPALVCWFFGRWFGMAVFGLPDPDGYENISAFFLGAAVFVTCAAVIGLFYLAGRIYEDWKYDHAR